MKHIVLLFCLSALATLFSGCNSGPLQPPGLPPMYPCVITITQADAPLADAMVSLHPTDGQQSWFTAGRTDADGKAKMWTYAKWEGAPVGKYTVTVEKSVTEGPENKEITYSYVAKKYIDPTTSDLAIEIVKGKSAQKFDVGAPVKDKVVN